MSTFAWTLLLFCLSINSSFHPFSYRHRWPPPSFWWQPPPPQPSSFLQQPPLRPSPWRIPSSEHPWRFVFCLLFGLFVVCSLRPPVLCPLVVSPLLVLQHLFFLLLDERRRMGGERARERWEGRGGKEICGNNVWSKRSTKREKVLLHCSDVSLCYKNTNMC